MKAFARSPASPASPTSPPTRKALAYFSIPTPVKLVQVAVNPISAQLFTLFPEPNTTQPGGNFVASPNLTNSTDQYLIKIDHHLEHGMLTARYSYTGATIFFPFQPGQGVTAIPGYGVNDKESTQLGSLGYTWFISPASLNEFRFGFTRVTGFTSNQPGAQAATYGFNTGWPAGCADGPRQHSQHHFFWRAGFRRQRDVKSRLDGQQSRRQLD